MKSNHESTGADETGPSTEDARHATLRAENERLRSELATRVTHRRIAALFLFLAAGAVTAVQVFPSERDVLFAIAGTGMFGAVLLLALTADRLLPAAAVESICDTTTRNRVAVAHALGADGPVRYVPTDPGTVRLYVAAAGYDDVPPGDALTATVVDRDGYYGLSLEPTGRDLVAELERTAGDLPDDVDAALPVLFEAVTDLFELADSIETVTEGESAGDSRDKIRVAVRDSNVGTPIGIDHPIASLVGVGLATVLDEPVETHTVTDDGEALLSFGWGEDGLDRPDDEDRDGERW